jgi:hypothetical protein
MTTLPDSIGAFLDDWNETRNYTYIDPTYIDSNTSTTITGTVSRTLTINWDWVQTFDNKNDKVEIDCYVNDEDLASEGKISQLYEMRKNQDKFELRLEKTSGKLKFRHPTCILHSLKAEYRSTRSVMQIIAKKLPK